jgi:hypothetical protein
VGSVAGADHPIHDLQVAGIDLHLGGSKPEQEVACLRCCLLDGGPDAIGDEAARARRRERRGRRVRGDLPQWVIRVSCPVATIF